MAALIDIRTDAGSLDLPKDFHNEFYVTRQIFDLSDFETRNADFTKTIQIPATPENIRILGELSVIQNSNQQTDNRVQCSISMNGIMIAPVAWILLSNTLITHLGTTFELFIMYGNFNMFDALSGDSIDKINWADIATDWEVVQLSAASTNTYLDNDLVFPVCDWLTRETLPMARTHGSSDGSIMANTAGFFLYARTIIERMLAEAGYTLVVGTVPADFNLIALACPVNKFMDIESISEVSLAATVLSAIDQLVVGITERAVYEPEDGAIWDNGLNQFQVTQNINDLTVKAFGSFDYVRGHPNNPPSRIVIFQNAVEIAAFSQDITAIGVQFFLSVQVNALINDIFYVELQADNTNAPASMDFLTGNRFQLFTAGQDLNRTVQPSEFIPQITQSTFLANILKLFNLLMVTDDIAKTVTVNSFDTIFSNEELDLSERVAGGKNDVLVKNSIASIGQQTHLKWIEDNLLRRDANTVIEFKNQILSKEVTVIDMIFSACDNSVLWYNDELTNDDTFLKAKIPQTSWVETAINVDITILADGSFTLVSPVTFQVGDYFKIGKALQTFRILRVISAITDDTGILQPPVGTLTGADYNVRGVFKLSSNDMEPRLAILREDSPQPVYNLEQGTPEAKQRFPLGALTANWMESLKMSEIAATYYGKIFNSLQSPSVIKTKFNLSIIELAYFDFTRPVYISQFNAFYYVNRINQFKVLHLTELELVRINDVETGAIDPPPPPPITNVKAHIIEATGTATILVYNLNVDGGNNVGPVGFAIFNEDQTVNFNARIRFTIGLYNMVVTNVGNGQSIGSWQLTTDVTRNEALIMNVANTPLWDGGDIQYQIIEIQT